MVTRTTDTEWIRFLFQWKKKTLSKNENLVLQIYCYKASTPLAVGEWT